MLYYFSTSAQVLAALAALLAVFAQFRITELKTLAIGIGKAIAERWYLDPGYEKHRMKLTNEKQSYGRLRDAVWRGDLIKVEEIIKESATKENKKRQESDHGFSASLRRFNLLNAQRKQLISNSKLTVILATVGIAMSISGIAALRFKALCVAELFFYATALPLVGTLGVMTYAITRGMKEVREWADNDVPSPSEPTDQAGGPSAPDTPDSPPAAASL